MEPIWKDYTIVLTNTTPAEGVQWRIQYLLDTIYSGRAFAAPGASNIAVKLNDILADYFETDWLGHPIFAVFVVQAYLSGTWTTKASLTFRPDWSYDRGYNPETDGCNFPMQRAVVPGQYLPLAYVNNSGNVVITSSTGGGDFLNSDFNDDFLLFDTISTTTTLTGNANGHEHRITIPSGAVSVVVDGVNRPVLPACAGQYVLYYVNAYGYWDYLIVKGKTDVADDLTRYTMKREYNNALSYSRGKWNYVNEIARKFTFHTEPLTDAQSALMPHLLNSPTVYCHDLAKNQVMPICLTANHTEHKRGSKLYQYAIEAEYGQEMYRR